MSYHHTNWTDEGFGLIQNCFTLFLMVCYYSAMIAMIAATFLIALTIDIGTGVYRLYQANLNKETN